LLLAILAMLTGVRPVFAQSGKISGTVTDMKGEPLPGVSVKLTGTKNGTVTDIQGAFSLTADVAKGTLEFSFLGFEMQTVPFTGAAVLNIKMQQATAK